MPLDYVSLWKQKHMSTLQTALLGCLFACVSAVVIWGTCYMFKNAIGVSFTYLPTIGTVTDVEAVHYRHGTLYYSPSCYSYVVDGQRYETSSLAPTASKNLIPGDPIALRYPADSPQDAVVDTPTPFWVFGFMLGIFAVLFSAGTVNQARELFRRYRRHKAGTQD